MNGRDQNDLSDLSMFELFRVESESQCGILTAGLLDLEKGAGSAQLLETLMRAAHSLKGAAKIINISAGVRLAHAMEDCFVAAQRGQLTIGRREIDLLLRGVDLLSQIAHNTEAEVASWAKAHAAEVNSCLKALADPKLMSPAPPVKPESRPDGAAEPPAKVQPDEPPAKHAVEPEVLHTTPVGGSGNNTEQGERVLRLNAENLNRLLALAGESLVEARWIRPFTDSMTRLKRMQTDLAETLSGLREELSSHPLPDRASERLHSALQCATECRSYLGERLLDLDVFDRRCVQLTHRLYLEALRTRMRPFADGVRRFPRMVRDIAHSLGKEVRLEISGENTPVDRDILDRLETPLGHLLRNAIDHGCEQPGERVAGGKRAECVLKIEARHAAGMLLVSVSDDGKGIDPERIREVVTRRRLLPAGMASRLTESELMQFLFLPGFTMKDEVTELSGRGVGLDIVHNMVRSVRGNVRINTQPERGTRFLL